jgi:hypothetical protein
VFDLWFSLRALAGGEQLTSIKQFENSGETYHVCCEPATPELAG